MTLGFVNAKYAFTVSKNFSLQRVVRAAVGATASWAAVLGYAPKRPAVLPPVSFLWMMLALTLHCAQSDTHSLRPVWADWWTLTAVTQNTLPAHGAPPGDYTKAGARPIAGAET